MKTTKASRSLFRRLWESSSMIFVGPAVSDPVPEPEDLLDDIGELLELVKKFVDRHQCPHSIDDNCHFSEPCTSCATIVEAREALREQT